MQYYLTSLLLASTTISHIAAAPVPVAFQSQWNHLQKRDDQATQAQHAVQQQAAQAMTQDQQAASVQNTQAVKQDTQAQANAQQIDAKAEQAKTQDTQAQQASNAVQNQDAKQDKDLSIGLGGLGLGVGVGVNAGTYSSPWYYNNAPYGYGGYAGYAGYGCAQCCTSVPCGWTPPPVVNTCGGLVSGLLCAVDAILKRK